MKREVDKISKNISVSSSGTMATKESSDDKESSYNVSTSEAKKESSKLVDRYGFYVSDDFHTSLLVSSEDAASRKIKEAERTTKWIKMVKNWNGVILNRQEKLKRRVRKGVPDHVRGFVWTKLSEASTYKQNYPDLEAIDIASLDELTADEVISCLVCNFFRFLRTESPRFHY